MRESGQEIKQDFQKRFPYLVKAVGVDCYAGPGSYALVAVKE